MINKAVTDILGHSQGRAIGKVFWNLFSEGVRSSSIRQINEGLRKGKRSFESQPAYNKCGRCQIA